MATQLRLLTIVLVGFALAPWAHAETRPSYGNVLAGAILEEPWEVDPLEVHSPSDATVSRLIFDTLYRRRGGKLEPHLAIALPDASDPKRVRIEIRPGVFFHNDQLVTASDVAKSLERVRGSKNLGWYFDDVLAIEVDGASLVIVLKQAEERLAERLSVIHTAITPGGRRPRWQHLVGSGPYRLKQRVASKRMLVLGSFEKHFAGRPYIDEIKLRWHENAKNEARDYERGLTHLSNRGEVAFAGHRPKYRTGELEAEATLLSFVGFGAAHPSLGANSDFRKALSLAIGRSSMAQIGSGELVIPTLHPLAQSHDLGSAAGSELGARTPEARKLVMRVAQSEAKLAAGDLSLEILVNRSRPDDRVIAGKVAAALFSLGIGSRIVSVRAAAFHRRIRAEECDLYIGQLAHTLASPKEQLVRAFVVGKVDAKVAHRLELPAAILKFEATLPIIPLFHKSLRVHYRQDVQGIGFDRSAGLAFENLFFFGSPDKN